MNVVPMTPICSCKVCRNVPLDSSYKDTLTFASVSAQISYFTGKAKYSYSNLTPIRMQNGIRLPVKADEIYDCNYIMFQNTNFGTKWFYAFIREINYINPNESIINFEIDVMQTWMFDYTVKPSFVEREHINDDSIGNNLIPENLEIGDYVSDSGSFVTQLIGRSIIVAATVDPSGADAVGGYYSGIYSGLQLNAFSTAAEVNAMIEALTVDVKSTAIVSIFMMPSVFVAQKGSTTPTSFTVSKPKQYSSLNGYHPRNNKLFTYPFNFLYVTNLEGNSANFKYEYFSTDTCEFTVSGDMSCNPQVTLWPTNYKNALNNYNEKIVLDGFPQCAYTIDSYKAWLAQNGSSMGISMLGSALSTSAQVAAGNPFAALGGVTNIAQSMAKIYVESAKPPQANGSTGSSSAFAQGFKNFHFYQMQIRAEFAEIIDEYFDIYGYATHAVKVPNITGRPSWNYVKTIDAKIIGSIPFEDIVQIKNNFNNGITFWHGDYVGDYTRNNK